MVRRHILLRPNVVCRNCYSNRLSYKPYSSPTGGKLTEMVTKITSTIRTFVPAKTFHEQADLNVLLSEHSCISELATCTGRSPDAGAGERPGGTKGLVSRVGFVSVVCRAFGFTVSPEFGLDFSLVQPRTGPSNSTVLLNARFAFQDLHCAPMLGFVL